MSKSFYSAPPAALLEQGLDALKLDPNLAEPLLQYLDLVQKWNRAYNLTGTNDLAELVVSHVLDSLAILPWMSGQTILDVGTGAGFPGIPLALCCPDKHFVLLDGLGKRIYFLEEVKRQLGLSQVHPLHLRAEQYHPSQGFDLILSRAFSSLDQMLNLTVHLLKEKGVWLAMKGVYPEEELEKLSLPYEVKSYQVPFLTAARCCVLISQ